MVKKFASSIGILTIGTILFLSGVLLGRMYPLEPNSPTEKTTQNKSFTDEFYSRIPQSVKDAFEEGHLILRVGPHELGGYHITIHEPAFRSSPIGVTKGECRQLEGEFCLQDIRFYDVPPEAPPIDPGEVDELLNPDGLPILRPKDF